MKTVAQQPMKFSEKLKRIASGVNKSKMAMSVGLPASTISAYIARGSIPRADIALKLARGLNVPVEWLIDDAQGWPPPESEGRPIADIPDVELVAEVYGRLSMFLTSIVETNPLAKLPKGASGKPLAKLPEARQPNQREAANVVVD